MRRQLDWVYPDGSLSGRLFWHNGGPLHGEAYTNRSRGVWLERTPSTVSGAQWLARSWSGAYAAMEALGFEPKRETE